MDVESGIGSTLYAMLAVALLVVAYPLAQSVRLVHTGLAGTRAPELIFLSVAVLVVIIGTVPASMLNVGWLLVPLLVVLVSLLYASVFAALLRAEGPAANRRLGAFVAPLVVIAVASAVESVEQRGNAAVADQGSVMMSWGFWSVAVLTVLPPTIAVASILVMQLRARSG